jgi:protocatechuate 3,4-dioxygenase beta subunit
VTERVERVSAELVALLDASAGTCQLFAEQEEGPYRRGEQPHRRDVTDGRPGSPLRLGLRLRTPSGEAVEGANVEIWHCDAAGRYSGYPPNDPSADADPSPQPAGYLPDETFLRGRQSTDGAGDVEFRTIHPGWYPGRTVHVHLTVHTATGHCTTQLYFPEALTAEVFARDPYRPHGLPDTTHATDGIFATGGRPAVLDVRDGVDGHVGVLCLVMPAERA